MQSKFKITASGVVNIYTINNNKRRLLLTSINAIMPSIKEAVAWLMSNSTMGKIDTVKVYQASGLLATGTITNTMHSSADATSVRYEVLFDIPSFSGDFDELQLWASNIISGEVAKVTGISGNKPVGEALLITWTITII